MFGDCLQVWARESIIFLGAIPCAYRGRKDDTDISARLSAADDVSRQKIVRRAYVIFIGAHCGSSFLPQNPIFWSSQSSSFCSRRAFSFHFSYNFADKPQASRSNTERGGREIERGWRGGWMDGWMDGDSVSMFETFDSLPVHDCRFFVS